MTYQTACERQETSNFWRQMLATRRQRGQFAFEVKKKQKYEVRSN